MNCLTNQFLCSIHSNLTFMHSCYYWIRNHLFANYFEMFLKWSTSTESTCTCESSWKQGNSFYTHLLSLFLCFSPPRSLCKGRTLYSVVRDAKVVLDVNKTRQIAQEMVKVRQLSADQPERSSLKQGKELTSPLSSGDGLPPRQGDYTQRHEVQECVLWQRQSCHHRLWALHHIWGVAGWQVITHTWEGNIFSFLQCRDLTEWRRWSSSNAFRMVQGQQNIQSSEK